MQKLKIRSLTPAIFSAIVVLFVSSACQKTSERSGDTPDPGVEVKPSSSLIVAGCSGVYSFDLATGSFDWKTYISYTDMDYTPYYDSGFLYVAGTQAVSAMDVKTGELKWHRRYYRGAGSYMVTLNGRLAPFVIDSILYAVGFEGPSFDVYLNALNKHTGEPLWRRLVYPHLYRDHIAQPKVIGDKILIVKKSGIDCIDMKSGTVRWQIKFRVTEINPAFHPQTDERFIYVFDKIQKKILAFDSENGQLSPGAIATPIDFDGNSFEVHGNFITGVSSISSSRYSTKYYVLDRGTGGLIHTSSPFEPGNLVYSNQVMWTSFNHDIVTETDMLYLYNPESVTAFERSGYTKKWETSLPMKMISDSLSGTGSTSIGRSGKLLALDNTLIQISSYRYYPNATTVEDIYMNVDVLDKYNGKHLASLQLRNPECFGVPSHYMVVKDGKAYYHSVDRP